MYTQSYIRNYYFMKSSTIIATVVIIVLAVGGWYWWSTQNTEVAGPSQAMGTNGSPNQGNLGQENTGQPQTPEGDGTGVSENLILGTNVSTTLGTYLTAYNGMTLYTYTKDTKGVSNCSGTCATNWPPYTVASPGDIHVPATITATIGTITRADGSLQVTYNGMPLYFWKSDTKIGDTTGQGVGGVWYVVKI
jgi:predicted lipoprotein with Yx(FWY)xxD motif